MEDEIEESKVPRVVYQAPRKEVCPLKGPNKRLDNITDELKQMTIEELQEKGAKYKELIEARDLEDCLFRG